MMAKGVAERAARGYTELMRALERFEEHGELLPAEAGLLRDVADARLFGESTVLACRDLVDAVLSTVRRRGVVSEAELVALRDRICHLPRVLPSASRRRPRALAAS